MYKLINKKTNEEAFCDKVTIDGFDYYVSDEKLQIGDYLQRNNDLPVLYTENFWFDFGVPYKKVIATNNPNIDIPKVVDEVEELSEKFIGCKYEDIEDSIDQIGYDSFKRGYNKSQETHPFSEEDVRWIFAKAVQLAPSTESHTRMISDEQYRNHVLDSLYSNVMKLWKEQQPKIVYYE